MGLAERVFGAETIAIDAIAVAIVMILVDS
jgi:hypothetical protein